MSKWSASAFDSAAFLKEKFRTVPSNPLFRKQAVKLTRERLFNGFLARNVRAASYGAGFLRARTSSRVL